jgi:hypothetical protein
MKYTDRKYHYSFEVPSGWRQQRRKLWFLFTGGKVAYESGDGRATFNFSVGRLDRPEWSDRATRQSAMTDFLNRAPGHYTTQDHGQLDIKLGGEVNTVAFWHRWPSGYGTIVSAYHEGIEYVFQSNDATHPQHEAEIRSVVESFKF